MHGWVPLLSRRNGGVQLAQRERDLGKAVRDVARETMRNDERFREDVER